MISALLAGCAENGEVVVTSPRRGGVHHRAPPAKLHIPKGHYPPPGSCRIWVPGVPPGAVLVRG